VAKRLVPTLAYPGSPEVNGGGRQAFGTCAEYADSGAAKWLFIPLDIPLAVFPDLTLFARQNQLRIAAILHERRESLVEGDADALAALETAQFEALSRCDKVFAASQQRYQQFYRFLLSSRVKHHSAEHRFGTVALPNEIKDVARPGKILRPAGSETRVLVWMTGAGRVHHFALANALIEVAERRSDHVNLTFLDGPHEDSRPPSASVRARMDSLPRARWVSTGAADNWNAQQIEEFDLVLYPGSDWRTSQEVAQSLWYGLPCLVHEDASSNAQSNEPGVAQCDMRNPDRLRTAFKDVLEADWRRVLAEEAVSRPCRTW